MAFFFRPLLRLVLKIFLNVSSLWFIAWLFKGITLTEWNSALLAVLTLLLINLLIRPFIMFLALPFNILSLGLMTFLINAILFKLTAVLTTGFDVEGFWTSVGGALFYSFFSVLINILL